MISSILQALLIPLITSHGYGKSSWIGISARVIWSRLYGSEFGSVLIFIEKFSTFARGYTSPPPLPPPPSHGVPFFRSLALRSCGGLGQRGGLSQPHWVDLDGAFFVVALRKVKKMTLTTEKHARWNKNNALLFGLFAVDGFFSHSFGWLRLQTICQGMDRLAE